jgi:serine/threonine-protein kinase
MDHLQPGEFVTVRSSEEGHSWVAEVGAAPIEGPGLSSVVEAHGSLTDGEAIAVAGRVAASLAAAHDAGLVHGSLEPGLVVLSPDDGAVQIGGFGGGASAAEEHGRHDADPIAGESVSPYLAPEQVAGDEPDSQSDLYALGCLMMTMLTGEPPLSSAVAGTGSGGSEATATRTGAPWPSDRKPDIDPALNGLVHDLLADSPTRRPVSAEEVVSRLGRIAADLADRQVVAVLPSAAGAAGAVAAAELPGGLPDDLPDESERTEVIAALGPEDDDSEQRGLAAVLGIGSIPWSWVAGSLSAVALVLVLLFMSLGGDDTEAPVAGPAPTAPAASTPSTTEGVPSSAPATPGTRTTSRTPTTTTATTTSTTTSASRTSSAPTATAAPVGSPQPQTLDGAVSSLRATVRSVVASGDVRAASGEDLVQLADELSRWVDRSSVQLSRRVSDLDSFVDSLSSSGEITSGGYQKVSGAIAAVQAQLA